MLTVLEDRFRLAQTFTISRGSKTEAQVLTVRIARDGATAWGECVPYARYGETLESVRRQIQGLPDGILRPDLQALLPAGAARNAVDCALWDLEAKAAGKRIWDLTGAPPPRPILTAYTLSLAAPETMQQAAARNAHRPILKVKLGSPDDLARLHAVRTGAPGSALLVDANEGWTAETYLALLPHLRAAGVALIEQPFPAGQDAALANLPRPIPVCADESCHDRSSLPALVGKYDVVNLKLDKTGGLTEGVLTLDLARAMGFGVMVGCMVGSSLAMAPAVLLAQGADWTDLDGPLLLAEDRPHPLRYDDAGVHPPDANLWG
ncbi:N-acetyl-D-Glu racemase DgcA [Rhodobacter calidifons]|uniref:Dipeptide epimerase n=1 Tax=Rhodobacter calidifons TaxID=2715277 RepID=A0ABX0G4B4_9RHOB|nr:N-acetyl-D-Glu racemase DgcA [Rhodobacter calidifons]NHB76044.1 dipeptide epimerase [Rhodobacter calidifons]